MKTKQKARAEMKKALPLIIKLLDDPKFVQSASDKGFKFNASGILKAFKNAFAEQYSSQYLLGYLVASFWALRHPDFVQCQENANVMGEWLKASKLKMTYENLDRAFVANWSKLKLQYPPQADIL